MEHFGVNSAPAGMHFLRNTTYVMPRERFADSATRSGVSGYHQARCSDIECYSGDHRFPIDTLNGEIFAGRPRVDGMTFFLERVDQLDREQTDRPVGPSMVLPVLLRIAFDSSEGYSRVLDVKLGNTALL